MKKPITFVLLCALSTLLGCGSGGSETDADNGNTGSNPPTQNYPFAAIGTGFFLKKDPTIGDTVSEAEISAILNVAMENGLSNTVRSYGMGAGLDKAGEIANSLGLRFICGVFLDADLNTNAVEIQTAISEANKGFCDTVVVGNETILFGTLTLQQQLDYINQVKAAVPASVNVTYSDTHVTYANNPSLFAAVDVAYINMHPFNHGIAVDNLQAMAAVDGWYTQMETLAGATPIVVAEIGYPSNGTNGNAIGSIANSSLFMHQVYSWSVQRNVNVHIFELADNLFKAKFGSGEDSYGIHDSDLNIKDAQTIDKIRNGELLDLSALDSIPGGPGTPIVEFTSVPPIGSTANLFGQVWHVDPQSHAVAVYIFVPGFGWVNKPFLDPRLTSIQRITGVFETDITTGGNDTSATQITAFVLNPSVFNAPSVFGEPNLPSELFNNAVVWTSVTR